MTDAPMKRTQFAQKGLDFVTLFSAKFAQEKVGGYRPVLREPIAESTGGGKQALQHMVLEPRIDGDPVLTVGAVNVVTKTARLRTFDCVRQLFAMRFGARPFVIGQSQYQPFFDRAMEFMKRQGLQVEVETRPPGASESSVPARAQANLVVAAFVVMLVVFAAAVVFLVVTRRVAF
jgi:hypothetical protein